MRTAAPLIEMYRTARDTNGLFPLQSAEATERPNNPYT